MIALISAAGAMIKYIKLWECQLQEKGRFSPEPPEVGHLRKNPLPPAGTAPVPEES
jgi:hypothetical protein